MFFVLVVRKRVFVLLVLRPKPTAHATMVHDPSADKKNQLIDSRTGALERLEQL
jgi:hypothetical protein